MAGELGPNWPEGSPFIETLRRNKVQGKTTYQDIVDPYLKGNIHKIVDKIVADAGFGACPPKQLHFDIDGNKLEAVEPKEEPGENEEQP